MQDSYALLILQLLAQIFIPLVKFADIPDKFPDEGYFITIGVSMAVFILQICYNYAHYTGWEFFPHVQITNSFDKFDIERCFLLCGERVGGWERKVQFHFKLIIGVRVSVHNISR